MPFLIGYLLSVNALGFLFMHIDKQKARCGAWRIPEKVLLGIALICGSIGCICGMWVFRHKTKHPVFSVGLPVILAVQVLLALFVFCFFQQKSFP